MSFLSRLKGNKKMPKLFTHFYYKTDYTTIENNSDI